MRQRFIIGLSLACVLFVGGLLRADETKAPQPVSFSRDILPVLSNKCFVCHGPDTKEKDLVRLDSFAAATRDLGGYQAINPEQPKKSQILKRIHSSDDPMPPEDAEKQLTNAERELITRWIHQGGTYAKHWAFVPPKKTLPKHQTLQHPIDIFIEQRLKEKKINFAPEADRATLARRAALILTGLPPEPEQLKAFLADEQSDAYERFVDQLLASSRFGEHQARYWLDAVRYGDTHGLHLDNRRGIYPYRDWVISAMNRNLPLDEFITWQLAGDLLPEPTLEQLVATGFVRMNPSTSEGGAIAKEFQAKNNFDRTENLGTVLLGMTLTCARCHTHKYDPIPQQEYYELFAFFNSTAEGAMDGNSYTYGPTVKAPGSVTAWEEWLRLEQERETLVSQQPEGVELSEDQQQQWESADAAGRLKLLADPKGPYHKTESHTRAVALMKQIQQNETTYTTTLIAKELPSPRTTHVLARGEYDLELGDPLQPGILKVMGSFPKAAPRNRLGLARWLTSREHPLVSRVLVNRIWQRTFGNGLVRTPEDFGLQGEQPTHPELLDWLAVELHDSEWDLKHMLKLMVTSRTFRQSSAWRTDVDDPENRLFARGPGFRLDAEVLRDLALWASGTLDPFMGGEGVKPYQPKGMWLALAHPGSNTKNYVRDKGDKLYRRSLYVYWKRTSPHPMMTMFDAPSREASCVKRSRTSTAMQSLGLFNETQRVELGRKLAERLLTTAKTDTDRLDLLFTLLASRPPTDQERNICMNLVRTTKERYQTAAPEAVALLSTGESPRNEKLDPAEHAAWTQLSITVLASDLAILLY